MKRIYITAVLAATLTACNDRPADATTTDAPVTNTTNATPAADSPVAAPIKDIAPKEGEVLLRLNYPKGFSQEVHFIATSKTDASTGTQSVIVDYDVTAVENNVYTFTGTVSSIKVNIEAQKKRVKYDSGKKLPANAGIEEKALDEGFKSIANKPFVFKLDKIGSIEQEIQFAGQNGDMQPLDLGNFQIPFPEEPVAVGANWSAKSPDKQTGGTRYNTYTVKKITDNTVVIDVKSVLPPPVNMKGAKESVFTGAYTLDRKTGMLLNGSIGGFVESMGGNVTMTFTGKKK